MQPSSKRMSCLICAVFLAPSNPVVGDDSASAGPQTPRIDSVLMLDPQPHESDPAIIWHDDFDDDARQEQYPEKSGDTTAEVRFGEAGRSFHMRYPKGSRGIGGRKVRGNYTGHGINAVFVEADWKQGSPVDQSRWIDNFVISTTRIGPVICPRNPVLLKTPYQGPGSQRGWIVEVATDAPAKSVLWRSDQLGNTGRVPVGTNDGHFVNALKGKQQLAAGADYVVRVRQQSNSGVWSPWSDWHQRFRTAAHAD